MSSEKKTGEPKISRRKFLFQAIGAAFTSAVGYIEYKTGLPSLITREKIPVWAESAIDHKEEKIELKIKSFLNEKSYTAEQIIVNTISENFLQSRSSKLTFIRFKSSASVKLQPALFGRRNFLIAEIAGISGPVAPVTGNYAYVSSENVTERNIDMQMPAYDYNGKSYGPTEFVDRLPYGVSSKINENASGGMVFENDSFEIVDKSGLENAKRKGLSFMQSWFTIDNMNEEQVLSQIWTHQMVDSEIGNSVYTWSAYVELTNSNGQKEKGLIVTNSLKDRLAIWNLVNVCKQLSKDGSYKLALMDAGNGNGVYIRPESDSDNYYSIGDKINDAHYSPLAVFVS